MSDKDEAIRIDNRGNFAGNINSPHGQVEVGKQQIELTPELEGLLREYMRDPVIAEEIVTAEDDEKKRRKIANTLASMAGISRKIATEFVVKFLAEVAMRGLPGAGA